MKFAFTTQDYSGRGSFLESFAFNRRFAPRIAFEEDNGAGGSTPPVSDPPKPDEDVSGLKSALQKERDQNKQLAKQFAQLQESVKGIDPEKYKQFEQLQKQAEQANQREAELKQQYEQQYTTQIESEQKKSQEWQQKYDALVKRTQVEKFYQAANGRSGGGEDGVTFFDNVYPFVDRYLKVNDRGELEVLDSNGVRRFNSKDASKVMTAAELFEELKSHPVLGHCFAPANNAKGGGMQQSVSSSLSGVDTSSMSPADRLRYVRSQKR